MDNTLFWARQIAKKVLDRKKFFFVDKDIPSLKGMSVKSSSSLSGVLHIGRLSDIIRGEAVFRALNENNSGVKFIYVTEDMDPLRSMPKGVPAHFDEFIGMPVSDVPDPFGCHISYADHFKEIFLESFSEFLFVLPKVFSMRTEYKRGAFVEYAQLLLQNVAGLKEIQNKFRRAPLDGAWSPWKPVCDKCGKIQTTVVLGVSKNSVSYACRDYSFEKFVARGCGHEGDSDLRKGNGKLVWKSEWAAQWKHWAVVSEGAGKEYNAPNSAWFINGEICEKILGFPMPEPIFYEHLLIGGQKMSASVGNVVFPHDWLSVARPEALKFLYLKRLAKTRSFSWSDVPNLELELDRAAKKFVSAVENGTGHDRDLFYFSSVAGREIVELPVDFSLVASVVNFFPDYASVVDKFLDMGLFSKNDLKKFSKQLAERVAHARKWVSLYGGPKFQVNFVETLGPETLGLIPKPAIGLFLDISKKIGAAKGAEEIQGFIFDVSKKHGVSPQVVFKGLYLAVLGREMGPKFGALVFAIGKGKIIKRLQELV